MFSRDEAVALDESDPLSGHRERFVIPDGLVYLDGNSLGAQQRHIAHAAQAVLDEWREQLIGGWQEAGWMALPATVGDKIASIIGAPAGSVLVADNTTANIFKALSVAVALRPDRRVLLAEESGFPTDLYVAASVAERAGLELRLVGRGADVADGLDASVAAALLNHVDFRTAAMLDIEATTREVHAAGGLAVWDLSHSAGVVPIEVTGADVDLAVGCTYKFLNGGPGAPAYVYAAPGVLEASQPIPGWLGHAEPFLMTPEYRPAPDVRRYMTGTPSIISMRVLDAALDIYAGVDIGLIRAKSVQLTDLFIQLVEERCDGFDLEIISPRRADERGSQVSLRHPSAAAVYERLVAAGVQGDFRTPDILRFGFSPLYVSHTDVWDAVDRLRAVFSAT